MPWPSLSYCGVLVHEAHAVIERQPLLTFQLSWM